MSSPGALSVDQQLFAGAPVPMVIGDLDAVMLRVNDACCELFGYAEQDLVGLRLGDLTHPDELQASPALRPVLRAGELTSALDKRYLRSDGRVIRAVVTFSATYTATGEPDGFAAVVQDVTRQREVEEALERERAFTEAVLDEIDVGVAAFDNDATLTVFNRFSRARSPLVHVGMRREQWQQHFVFLRADGTAPLPLEEWPLLRALAGERVRDAEVVMGTERGGRRTVLFNALPLMDRDGSQVGAVVSSLDITASRVAEQSLSEQALQDPLTGLPNRALLTDRIQRVTRSQEHRSQPFALVLLDLDDFSTVNDRHGRDVGDLTLLTVAARLQGWLRPEDTLAHFGGGEFAVLLEHTSSELALGLAHTLRASIKDGADVGGQRIGCRASVGVAVGRAQQSAAELLRDAELAMHTAKDRGKDTVAVYEPWMHRDLMERLAVDQALADALARGQLRLVYQPVIDLTTSRICGFEALCRWQHPTYGAVPPSCFIARAEATGLIVPLGAWVLRTAVQQLAEWQREHPRLPRLSLSVNLSALQLADPGIVDEVFSALETAEVPPEQLVLEVTETAIMSGAGTEALNSLHARGVVLAVDDFGTGFSSLGRLHSLPVRVVKIDKSFVDTVEPGRPAPIVTATLAMARALGLGTVAEGVESAAQADFLRGAGCDRAQGFHFGRPTERDDVASLLDTDDSGPQRCIDR